MPECIPVPCYLNLYPLRMNLYLHLHRMNPYNHHMTPYLLPMNLYLHLHHVDPYNHHRTCTYPV